MKRPHAKDFIKDLEKNIFCRLRPSRVHGVGVFAIRDIPKGTHPFKSFLSYRFTAVSATSVSNNAKIDPAVKELANDMYSVTGGKLYLYEGGLNGIDVSFFLNHSEKPNLIAKNDGKDFVAARKIKKGEELFSDHRMYSDNFIAKALHSRNNR